MFFRIRRGPRVGRPSLWGPDQDPKVFLLK
jgi:hypothetical protein